jgi:TonB family protein
VPKSRETDVETDPALRSLRGRPRLAKVDSAPVLRGALRIPYPEQLAQQGARGRAVFWVLVSATGKVADVRVLQSSGSEALDAAAAEAIQQSSYAPARDDDRAVAAWTQQQIVGLCCRSGPSR